ncbi:MAG: Uma2 family endonuclease, partial [Blastocatellia bacterium]
GFSFGIEGYEPIEPNERGWRWSQVLGLYLGVDNGQLRYITGDGRVVPTPEEDAELAMMNAEDEARKAEQNKKLAASEKARAETEKARAEALATKLRELGIDPESLS